MGIAISLHRPDKLGLLIMGGVMPGASDHRFLLAGSSAGLVIVIGELILNGWLLLPEWQLSLTRLGLTQPDGSMAVGGFLKLFVLGYVVAWLYTALTPTFGRGTKSAVIAGLLVAGLIWVWVMIGLWMAGYVTWTIAWVTMIWGLVELPIAAWIAARILDRGTAS